VLRPPPEARDAVAARADPASTLESSCQSCRCPSSLGHGAGGEATNSTIDELATHFEAGDVIVDGGTQLQRAQEIAPTGEKGLVCRCGTPAVYGADEGYCLMVGGTKKRGRVEPAF